MECVTLENDLLRVVVLPDAGGKIWQITYKPLAADLLWNNPDTSPSPQPLYANYDDNWSGGWDELFPNDEAVTWAGRSLPDHGELWTGAWAPEPLQRCDGEGLRLTFTTPLTQFHATKDLLLSRSGSVLEVRYSLTNGSSEPLPFLWKLHPAFAVSPSHRIDFPPMTVVREPDFPGTLGDAPLAFDWPFTSADEGTDLRIVPPVSSKAVHFFYGNDMSDGWCGITDRKKRLAAGLRFDPAVFSTCWLFATHGGWKDLNVAVLEPATGYPFQMKAMVESGRARILGPGESLETTVLFSVREGVDSIGRILPDGTICPGDPL